MTSLTATSGGRAHPTHVSSDDRLDERRGGVDVSVTPHHGARFSCRVRRLVKILFDFGVDQPHLAECRSASEREAG